MRNLPNVQYQNDTDTNAGVDGQKEIDTRPLLLSINGGRTYENNFMLNGVSINTITGPVERAAASLSSDENTPNADLVYGLHPQTVFVPIEFLESATVIDSNASAEYGNFQGGVVLYDLAKPPTDRYRASVSYDRHTDKMVHYKLATEDGTNPLNRKAPTFEKNNLAVSLGAPISNQLSFIAQASRKEAETTKQKEYTYFDGSVDEWSENNFYRGALALRTGIGRFTLDSSFTDYTQTWESIAWRDLQLDTESQSSSTQLEYLASLSSFAAPSIGLGDVTLKSRAYYNNSDTSNYSNSDVAYARSGQKRRRVGIIWQDTFDSTELDDWCRADPISSLPLTGGPTSNTVCREGGYGDKEQGQTDIGVQAQLNGRLLFGSFKAGADARSIEGRRARLSDFTYYTNFYTATGNTTNNAPPAGFSCPPGDPVCSREQFANIKTVWRAFDVAETVNAATAFTELDQTWGWLNVRGGLRLDYEDYFENLNLAPRVAATARVLDGVSLTAGFNRYFQGETLYYALRDAQPRGQAYTRTHAAGNVAANFTQAGNTGGYRYRSADLDTPYIDEYTAGLSIRDPLVGGNLRLRYLERFSLDRFAARNCGSNCSELSNDGESFYRSASAEYGKFWRGMDVPLLSSAGLSANVTWSEQTSSRNTYIDADGEDELILYNGQSYSLESFSAVTGNLDIPIRIGAAFTSTWFNDRLMVNLSAGYNLGYDGVYDTGRNETFNGRLHNVWEDTTFDPTLTVDLTGQILVTEQAAVEFQVNNLLDDVGNARSSNSNPWVRGRSFWAGSTLRF